MVHFRHFFCVCVGGGGGVKGECPDWLFLGDYHMTISCQSPVIISSLLPPGNHL